MNLRTFSSLLQATMILLLLSSTVIWSQSNEQHSREGKGAAIQRVPKGAFENLQNHVSNISYYTTNYGIFGLNIASTAAGGIWPRGSSNAYIFGGGVWFGAQKRVQDTLRKLTAMSYNPNSGQSWMVPGRIGNDPTSSPVDQSSDGVNKYRLYFSTDYSAQSGEPVDPADKAQGGPNWPIWDTHAGDTLRSGHYLGQYVEDPSQRNSATYPKGPAIVSGEDLFSTYKDTDIGKYEIKSQDALKEGYPLGLQVEQTDYSWGFGKYADFMFIRYQFINRSHDTLHECWVGPVVDPDIGNANNDHNKIVIDNAVNDSLDLAVQWSDTEARQYGYLGYDLVESPAVDEEGFIRTDKKIYAADEQIGLSTFKKWVIANDPKASEERYNYLSAMTHDGDTGPGDTKWLLATGPFNMRPGDTARIVIAILFAYGKSTTANGTWDDMHDLIELDRFAQQVYDGNFPQIQSSVDPADDAVASPIVTLAGSYPNPAGGTAMIEYSLREGTSVMLTLFDLNGAELQHQNLGYQPAGEHTITLDASSLAPGVYFYEIRAANESARGKMVVE